MVRSYIAMRGVTAMPCSTMEATTTDSVIDVSWSASVAGSP